MRSMIALGLSLALTSYPVWLSAAESSQDPVAKDMVSDEVPAEVIAGYQQVIKGFMESLKTELKSAMKAGGPVNAISVCHLTAPQIAEQTASAHELSIHRVSLKSRNPDNGVEPGSWQESVLQQFAADQAAGKDPAELVYAAVKTIDDAPHYVYMKAIPTAELCLHCHGSELKAEVQAKIDELYPEDKAVGYQTGEIRGAFLIQQAQATLAAE